VFTFMATVQKFIQSCFFDVEPPDPQQPQPQAAKPRKPMSDAARRRAARKAAMKQQQVLFTGTGRVKKPRDHKPIENPLYSMEAGLVDANFPEEHIAIQEEIKRRCANVRDTWTEKHAHKANCWKVPGIVLMPMDGVSVDSDEGFD